VIDRNLVHECGIVKGNPAIYAPGIRVVTGGSATITNNTIWATPGDGIALAPNAQGARISNNVIDGTANGIFLSGDAKFTSNGNTITQNIISFVAGYAAHGSNPTGKPVGARNVVSKNCVWQPGRGLFAGSGFTAPANRVLDPQYQNRPATLALKRSSPCWNQRPRP
jgi:parallel beta-helix repeat protein